MEIGVSAFAWTHRAVEESPLCRAAGSDCISKPGQGAFTQLQASNIGVSC